MGEFDEEHSIIAEALTYCDLTTGPDGEELTPTERLDEILARYGPDHVVARSIGEARPGLLHVAAGMEARLRSLGLA